MKFSTRPKVIEGLDFISSHFEHPIWPRTISTKTTEGRQVLVYNKEETLARYEQANYLDCRISGYPDYTQWNGINRQAPNFIFIDLDLSRFAQSQKRVLHASLWKLTPPWKLTPLRKTLKNIREKLDNAEPSVIWSGNGYHLYLPTKALVLESESVFAFFENPSMKFLRFAEAYLTNNKGDSCHGNSLSFRNCMLRIPGSHNSKCVLRYDGIANSSTEVKIIQRWDGKRPAINWLLRDFRRYLIQEKINDRFKDAKLKRKRSSYCYPTNHTTTTASHSIRWIDSLLETPIEDHRKYAIWRIIAPYLINARKLSHEEAFRIIRDWLNKCHQLKRLDFDLNQKIKYDLGSVSSYRPISFNNLKVDNPELYSLISNRIKNAK
jgi:hypothetical protein